MKIIFIINSISAQRCIKRVEEFVSHGYEVEVYGFNREKGMYTKPKHFSVELIGEYDDTLSYFQRIPILKKGIKFVMNKHRHDEDVIYYLFQLDIALVFKLLTYNCKYLFEESDLMHTYINNPFIRNSLEFIDKWIIKHSVLSIFTSEGFLLYHYANKRPNNVCVITNRLNSEIIKIEKKEKHIESGKLRIGFVGNPRYNSIINFIRVFCHNFPQYELHIYGEIKGRYKNNFETLHQFHNCHFHGQFKNPEDLPSIYSEIDLVLSTYDAEYINVRYAEPNKLYEAIYFETPIIVSEGTFLSDKVKKMGVGYSVDPLNEQSIINLIKNIDKDSIRDKEIACKRIEKEICININDDFFNQLHEILH